MKEAGELEKAGDYDKIVNNSYAEKAIKEVKQEIIVRRPMIVQKHWEVDEFSNVPVESILGRSQNF